MLHITKAPAPLSKEQKDKVRAELTAKIAASPYMTEAPPEAYGKAFVIGGQSPSTPPKKP